MSSEYVISVTYWNHFLRYANENEINLQPLGEQIEVEEGQQFIPLSQVKSLIAFLLEQDIDPWFGMEVGNNILVSSHGHLGFGLSHAKDFKQYLDFMVKFYQTRSQIMVLSLETHSDCVYLNVSPCGDWQPAEIVFYEGILKMLLNLIRFAIGNVVDQCVVELPYSAPSWQDKYTILLNANVQFDTAVARIRMPIQWLAISCLSGDAQTLNMAQEQCEVELSRLTKQHLLQDKITQLIESSQRYDLSIEEMAKQLSMSKSTLIRKLHQEGTSYKHIIEALKRRYASRLLIQTNQKLDVIAIQLGYEDVSNFSRTFKRWFGISPGHYREQNQ